MSSSSPQAKQFYGTLILGLLLYNVEDDIKKTLSWIFNSNTTIAGNKNNLYRKL